MASESREEAVKFVREGAVLAQCERFRNAIQYFDEAIKLDPNFATAWFMKGQALIDSGDDLSPASKGVCSLIPKWVLHG